MNTIGAGLNIYVKQASNFNMIKFYFIKRNLLTNFNVRRFYGFIFTDKKKIF